MTPREYSERDLDVADDLATLKANMFHVLEALNRIENTCKTRASCALAPAPGQPVLSGRVWTAIAGVSGFVSAMILGIIAILPAAFSGIAKLAAVVAGYVQNKP